MSIFSIFIQVALLWFLITLFSGSTNSTQSLRESWIVVIGMMIVGLLSRLVFGGIFGLLAIVVDVVVLYFLVDKVCGTAKQTTLRICGWYFGISLLLRVGMGVLLS